MPVFVRVQTMEKVRIPDASFVKATSSVAKRKDTIWKFISIIVSFLFAIGQQHDNEGAVLPGGTACSARHFYTIVI